MLEHLSLLPRSLSIMAASLNCPAVLGANDFHCDWSLRVSNPWLIFLNLSVCPPLTVLQNPKLHENLDCHLLPKSGKHSVRDPKVTEHMDPPITPYEVYACLLRRGQRSQAGCSSWGHKESDTIKRLSARMHTHTHTHTPLHHGCSISLHTVDDRHDLRS